MKKRLSKKRLKQQGKYIEPSEIWNLDQTIAKFILPRLKKFRNVVHSHPVTDEVKTFEDWQEVLDKMIIAFEYILECDEWWIGNPEYDHFRGCGIPLRILETKDGVLYPCEPSILEKENFKNSIMTIKERKRKEELRRQEVINVGLQLFAKYFQHLWD